MPKNIVKIVIPKYLYPTIFQVLKNQYKIKNGFISRYNDAIAYKQNQNTYTIFYDYDDKNLKCFYLNSIKYYYYDYIPDEKIPDINF